MFPAVRVLSRLRRWLPDGYRVIFGFNVFYPMSVLPSRQKNRANAVLKRKICHFVNEIEVLGFRCKN